MFQIDSFTPVLRLFVDDCTSGFVTAFAQNFIQIFRERAAHYGRTIFAAISPDLHLFLYFAMVRLMKVFLHFASFVPVFMIISGHFMFQF